jgi:hypothetical protein
MTLNLLGTVLIAAQALTLCGALRIVLDRMLEKAGF